MKNHPIPPVIPADPAGQGQLGNAFEFIGNAIEWMRDRPAAALEFFLGCRHGSPRTCGPSIKDWFVNDLPSYFETAMDKIGA